MNRRIRFRKIITIIIGILVLGCFTEIIWANNNYIIEDENIEFNILSNDINNIFIEDIIEETEEDIEKLEEDENVESEDIESEDIDSEEELEGDKPEDIKPEDLKYSIKFNLERYDYLKDIDDEILTKKSIENGILSKPKDIEEKIKSIRNVTIKGWYIDEDLKEEFIFENENNIEPTKVNDDIILYPKIVYEIKFNPSLGKFKEEEIKEDKLYIIEKLADKEIRLEKSEVPEVESEDKIFKYWGYIDVNDKIKEFNKYATVRSNIELIAEWKDSIRVTFNSNGGTLYKDTIITEDDILSSEEYLPMKKNSNFKKWVDQNGRVIELDKSSLNNVYIIDENNFTEDEKLSNEIKEGSWNLWAVWDDDKYDISNMKTTVSFEEKNNSKYLVIRPGLIESKTEDKYWLIINIRDENGKKVAFIQNEINMKKRSGVYRSNINASFKIDKEEESIYEVEVLVWNNRKEQMSIRNKTKDFIKL